MNFEELRELWAFCSAQYISLFRYPENIPPDSMAQEAGEISISLIEIFAHLTHKARIRDKWQFKWTYSQNGVLVFAMSEKQMHEYVFGIISEELCIESCILEPQNIRLMTNEYWVTLSNLDLLKSFSFHENAVLPKSIPIDITTGKASTYKIIRNYVLFDEHHSQSICDLGFYKGSWPMEGLSENDLNEVVDVIKGIHKLNYLSYRREYQRNHRKA